MWTTARTPSLILALCWACSAPDLGIDTPEGFSESAPGHFEAKVGFLRADLDTNGVVIRRGDAELKLRFAAWGRAGVTNPIDPVVPQLGACTVGGPDIGCPGRVELVHPGVTETWQTVPGGIEQSWRVGERPPGVGSLVLDVALTPGTSVTVDPAGTGARLVDPHGRAWRYGGLAAWDADSRDLEAWLVPTPSGLRVVVDDGDAVYPIEVDPTTTEDTKLVALDNAFVYPWGSTNSFGMSVSSAGDVNGDGFDDVIVGAPWDNDLGDAAGAVYVFQGGPDGIQPDVATKLKASDGAELNFFGHDVSDAGDVNGDGFDDVIVGAYGHNANGEYSGAAYLYFGDANGIEPASEIELTQSDGASNNAFGFSVSGAGDVNADGYDDVIVGTGWYFGVVPSAAYVYLGGSEGIADEIKLTTAEGEPQDHYGAEVSGAGDVNADGYDDVVVGAPGVNEAGSTYVYLGADDGLRMNSELKVVASDGSGAAAFGLSLGDAGDVNDDGYDDVVVGSIANDDTDSAYLYLGSNSGIDIDTETKLVPPNGNRDTFGASVSGAGDLDGDGYDDVIVGGPWVGEAYVYLGQSNGIDAISRTTIESHNDVQNTPGEFGASLASAGDVDGDGYADLIVGDPQDTNVIGYLAGAAFLYYGDCITPVWYFDADGDGYGTDGSALLGCEALVGYIDRGGDCDDDDPLTFPGGVEIADDGIDQDCSGSDHKLVGGSREAQATQGNAGDMDTPTQGCGCSSGAGSPSGIWLVLGGLLMCARRR